MWMRWRPNGLCDIRWAFTISPNRSLFGGQEPRRVPFVGGQKPKSVSPYGTISYTVLPNTMRKLPYTFGWRIVTCRTTFRNTYHLVYQPISHVWLDRCNYPLLSRRDNWLRFGLTTSRAIYDVPLLSRHHVHPWFDIFHYHAEFDHDMNGCEKQNMKTANLYRPVQML